jgi:Uma2 family endonuclease
VVAVGPEAEYQHRHPGPRDLLFLIKVSDSTLDDDTTTKLRLYAAEKVIQYWVVNLVDRRVEVYTHPRCGKTPSYRTRTE